MPPMNRGGGNPDALMNLLVTPQQILNVRLRLVDRRPTQCGHQPVHSLRLFLHDRKNLCNAFRSG
jgi:hypothetical protein